QVGAGHGEPRLRQRHQHLVRAQEGGQPQQGAAAVHVHQRRRVGGQQGFGDGGQRQGLAAQQGNFVFHGGTPGNAPMVAAGTGGGRSEERRVGRETRERRG